MHPHLSDFAVGKRPYLRILESDVLTYKVQWDLNDVRCVRIGWGDRTRMLFAISVPDDLSECHNSGIAGRAGKSNAALWCVQ